MDINKKEELEINYWRDSEFESPKKFSKGNLLNKLQECRNLDYKINKHLNIIKNKKSILEIGAGQGWASCYLKSFYLKHSEFTVTDISSYAIESIVNWEKLFEVKIDKYYAAKSYKLSENDNQFDLIFCYAAAHHFVLYEETLIELKRVLKDNGYILFLYEPTSSKLFYTLHRYYVNKMPHHTPEDVILPSRIKLICSKIGLNYENQYDPYQPIIRNIPIGLYFSLIKRIPILQKVLPSSSDLIFTKLKK